MFGISKSAANRIVARTGPLFALKQRQRFRKGTVRIADGTLVPTRDQSIAEQSKNYRYSTNHQVVVDADTRLVVGVGRPVPGSRNDCKAWTESGAEAAVAKTTTIADGGYPGTGLGSRIDATSAVNYAIGSKSTTAPTSKAEPASSTSSPPMKTWKVLRDCRRKGERAG